ncbi:interleukin-9 receptor [Orycteropus afer afer]|uniref:Interleukin-9 receptor n=1 Tax=Orycteropus afer afer TaxID=1230840 RepID=A0A8B7BA48_ORYAF|nr:interleukin-9 receptor [Orycteropus afer afer]
MAQGRHLRGGRVHRDSQVPRGGSCPPAGVRTEPELGGALFVDKLVESLYVGPGALSVGGWTLEGKALMQEVGTWFLVCTCVCTCVCWGTSLPAGGGGSGLGSITCLNNNILRIECHWAAPALSQGTEPWLLLTSDHAPGSKHRCVFQASTCSVELPLEEVLMPTDSFTITLHHHVAGQEQISLVNAQYLPRKHVKLDPPSGLRSNVSSDSCILTWSIDPALEPLAGLLAYELAFKRQEEAWERAQHKDHIVGVSRLTLEATEMDPGCTYEARLRVHMAQEGSTAEEERYEGPWSEWGPPVRFSAPQRPGSSAPPWGRPDSTLLAVSIFLLLSSLTYLLFKLSPRVKRVFRQHVPSPAAFFQPLYTEHHGNFQTWTGAQRVGLQLGQEGVSAQPGGPWPSCREAVALLTYSPARPWQPSCSEEEGPPALGSEGLLPAEGLDGVGQPPAYLPQEDWASVSPTRPGLPDSEGGNNSYCALGYYRGCHPSATPGYTQSPLPSPVLACGFSWNQTYLDPQHELLCGSWSQSEPGLQ